MLFSPIFLEWMGTPSDVFGGAVDYLRIYFIGVPAMMIYNYGATIVRTTGDTKTPLLILASSGLLNVALNLVTVVGMGMAEEGVATATVVSNYASAIAIVLYQLKSGGSTRLYLRRLRIDWGLFVRILRCGLPAGIQSSVFSFANVLLQSAVNSLGSTIMAGCVAAGNIDAFIYVAQNAFYQATLTFTGQNVGARKYERIGLVMRWGFLFSMITWLITGGGLLLFGEQLIGLYLPNNPESIAPGMEKLFVLATTYFLCGLNEVVVGASRGMGASFSPMLVSIFGICGVRSLWALVIFPLHPTVALLHVAFPVSWGLTFLIQIPINRRAKRRLVESGKTVLS
jgi:putative MATE family efflux protein